MINLPSERLAKIRFRKADPADAEALLRYLTQLSEESRKRFGPHAFDRETIHTIIENKDGRFFPFIAENILLHEIIAYFLIHASWIPGDVPRLQSYGLICHESTDCTFAPSVADAWQNQGLGSWLFQQLKIILQNLGFTRVFLWGGVQSSNSLAIRFYEKEGFRKIGEFEYHGGNLDLVLENF